MLHIGEQNSMQLQTHETLYKYNNKSQARKAYNAGQPIVIVPHKVSPLSYFNLDMEIQDNSENLTETDTETDTFDYRVNNYEVYNCNYECGYYCSYYTKIDKG